MEFHRLAPQSCPTADPGPLTPPAGRALRIALLCPRGPLYRHRGGIWKKTMRYAPLTLTTLASLIPPDIPAEVALLDEGVDEIDPGAIDADLVGITVITGTAPRAYELAREFRARNIPVVLGGVHPTLVPEEAVRHADSVVVGYAEESWPQLLRDFAAGRMQRRYDQSPRLKLDGLPFPRRDLYKRGMVNISDTIEATRGCIFQCEFCVVPAAWGTRPLQKPVGAWIPLDKQEAVFEPFVQLDRGLTRTTDGTGLGLAISRGLARQMGGDIMLESKVGRGSVFTVMVPLGVPRAKTG